MVTRLFYYNQNDYDYLDYNKPDGSKATIASGGCGVVSACIAINTLAQKTVYTVKQMRNLAKSSGARGYDGTDEKTLLNAICKAHPEFSFKMTCSENELVAHLEKGGTAVCNQGNDYNVFSTGGHFVCAWRMVGDNIDVADPSMYIGKYDKSPRPERIVKKTDTGCIVTPAKMGLATQDRNPAYFLITYKGAKKDVKYFTANATILNNTNVYADNNMNVKVGSVSKNTRVAVLKKGKTFCVIQYNLDIGGYKVGLIKMSNIKIDK